MLTERDELAAEAARRIWTWLQEDHPPDYGDAYIINVPRIITEVYAPLLAAVDAVLEDYGPEKAWPTMSNMQTMIALAAARRGSRV